MDSTGNQIICRAWVILQQEPFPPAAKQLISHETEEVMTYKRGLRIVSVVSSAALILGAATAMPADAKKKKKKKKKKPPVCATYTPSEWGAGQPINLVTDAHTSEAPLEITVPTGAGLGSSSSAPPAEEPDNPVSHAFLNVQVDSKAPEAGLYGSVSFAPMWDYDFFFRDNTGIGLAYSAGFAEGVPVLDGTGNGGHTGMGSENIDGLTTADCTGYLVDIVSATTLGEDVTLTLWLGEPAFTPGS